MDIIIDEDKKKAYEFNKKKMDKNIYLNLKRVAYNILNKLRLFKK